MATANASLSLASLDFDTLKNSLKAFLSTQSAFKDYDYEGSNMNVLLDVLAYNTFQNAFYLNMTASEMFLDSAQLRSSVVSHAKELNYIPRSRRSARATIDITIPTTNAVVLTVPKGTSFTGKNINGNYTFTTDKTITLTSGNNTFLAANVNIYEGSYSQDAFVIDYSDVTQKFTLLNPNIDTDSLMVVVSENNGANTSEYLRADSLFGLTGNSSVYFLQTDIDGRYQITFGDDVCGRKPLNGSVITAEYRSCSGELANAVDTFAPENDLGAINNTEVTAGLSVTTVSSSADGAALESIESIRYNAPRHFQTQERAVTTQDYIDLITANFPDIESINAYGGETVSQFGDVEYGKVYISCSTYSGNPLTDIRKADLLAFLQPRAILGITPTLIDPEYIYLTLASKVHVDFNQTGLTAAQMNTVVVNAISTYNTDYLMRLGYNFRLSNLMSSINLADTSIISNETTPYMYRKFADLESYTNSPLIADFHGNAIKQGSILSNKFSSNSKSYIFTDYISGVTNTSGNIYRVEQTLNTSTVSYSVVGSVNYNTGYVSIRAMPYDSTPANGLKIFASPVNQDIYSSRNNILEIDTGAGLSISIVSE
jgi:hypothetical protein